MGTFNDKLVVVTGASRGIGLETAKAFLEAGARVVLLGHNVERLEAARASVADWGERAQTLMCNLEDAADIERVFTDIEAGYGAVDVLVNNAGAYSELSPWNKITDAQWYGAFDLNTLAPYRCTVAAVRGMQKAGKKGCIVNVGSSSALQFKNGRTHYTVSKVGEHALTQVMAMDLAPLGIRVNMVSPGRTATEKAKARLADPAQRGIEEQIMKRIPLGRYAATRDIANAVLFLADNEKAGFITGAILPVDGGYTLGVSQQ